jgi:uncharacterized protein (DUF1499 family)
MFGSQPGVLLGCSATLVRVVRKGLRIWLTVALALLGLAMAGVGLRLYMERAAENGLRPGEDIAFATLPDPLPSNAFVACPPGYCRVTGVMASPIFTVDADQLYRLWTQMLADEPRIVQLVADPARRRIVVLQRSALFRFPDVVTAEFVPLDGGRSSLAVHSRARYGSADFGVNRRRVTTWLQHLEQLAPAQGP